MQSTEEDLANQGKDDNQGGNGGQGGNTENPDSQGGQDDINTPGGQDGQNNQNGQNGNGTDPSESAGNSGNQTVNQQKIVQTGDSSPILLWTAVLAVSAVLIVIFEKKRRKQL